MSNGYASRTGAGPETSRTEGAEYRAATGRPAGICRVAILVAVYNGEKYLQEQLESLAAQTVEHIDIWVSDDGSTDRSRTILHDWQSKWEKGTFHIMSGPSKGFAENFRSLMANADIEADYFAFCDQDDIWDPDKLSAAVSVLESNANERLGLYCSRTRIIGEDGQTIGQSPLFARPPHFRNAIVQSIGGGNTMVLNRRAWSLMAESARRTSFVSHDWWCYLLISGAGGYVHYDPTPRIGYRQHTGNLVGDNMSVRARADRFKRLLTGRFAKWNDENLSGLDKCADLLTEEARATMAQFKSIRASRHAGAVVSYLRSGMYRQTLAANIMLCIAIFLGRL
ncbi:glycosyltransferase family 2 protein [Mesorhizobium xinjiangense]|uniref:glycosyltransferase family 2 protein n=1 Tax=Mesorhizobium xinjiangense TaxID=2678685 RepID=UPI001F3688E7|nr:glycosyltransferase family 2 protein [Mesorhizobium xinjiangense]